MALLKKSGFPIYSKLEAGEKGMGGNILERLLKPQDKIFQEPKKLVQRSI